VTGEREKALARNDLDEFDLVISDLSEAEVNGRPIGDLQTQAPRNSVYSQIERSRNH
jgi:hypothetical protein